MSSIGIGLSQRPATKKSQRGPKVQPVRPVARQGQLPADRHQRMRVAVGARQRDRGEQPARIGMAHVVEHLLDAAEFDRLARNT